MQTEKRKFSKQKNFLFDGIVCTWPLDPFRKHLRWKIISFTFQKHEIVAVDDFMLTQW